ncbi:hypothetical protein CI238_02625, partial [Colletotrichum incanum]
LPASGLSNWRPATASLLESLWTDEWHSTTLETTLGPPHHCHRNVVQHPTLFGRQCLVSPLPRGALRDWRTESMEPISPTTTPTTTPAPLLAGYSFVPSACTATASLNSYW